MSRKSKSKRNGGPVPASKRRLSSTVGWIVVVLAVAAISGYRGWKSRQPSSAPAAAGTSNVSATNAPAVVVAGDGSGFQKLKGRWQRPDGGYVVEIRDVDAAGKMDASYSNPRPIHVSQAQASRVGALTKVFIELRDVNYPGSTYTLTYEPASDQLAGIYYQALQQQSFEVAFVRSP